MARFDRMVGFVMTMNPDKAKEFYGEKLGLRFLRDDGFALVFDAHGTMVRVVKMQHFTPSQGTVLGWEVSDIVASVRELGQAGGKFEQYGFMNPDAQGVVTFSTGDKVAWFKDPDGNVLSISQHATT